MSIPFYSDIDLNNNKIINSGNPINNTDLINKLYVDTQVSTLTSNINTELQDLQTTIETNVTSQINLVNTTLSNRITNEVNGLNQAILDNVINRLDSTSATNALSANQGYILNNKITNLENIKNVYGTIPTTIGIYLNYDLYRYVIIKSFNAQPATPNLDIELTELSASDIPINVYGIIYDTTNVKFFSNNISTLDSVTINGYNKQTKMLSITLGNDIITNWSNDYVLYITIEYTQI